MGLAGNFMRQVENLMSHVGNFMGYIRNPKGQVGNPMGQNGSFFDINLKLKTVIYKSQQFVSV